ncbi:sialoadhesin-like, partial [Pygocentrus nattereri]|uniref:sialoadhesin-like n=1 Tax=Pygocentrus nattereri TaxID=42514 RepID=UPI00189133DA
MQHSRFVYTRDQLIALQPVGMATRTTNIPEELWRQMHRGCRGGINKHRKKKGYGQREDIPDDHVSINGFQTVRADRGCTESGKRKGGGLAVLVNNRWCNPGHITIKERTCCPDIELTRSAGWTFYWSKHTQSSEKETITNVYTISSVSLSDGDVAQAVLSVSPQSWLTEGESVTLSCEVTGSSTGWTFSWYRAALYRQGLEQIRDVHGNVLYHVELLSDSRREAGGSYTLSPAAVNHTGVYVCRAGRGEPAYQTQYSTAQTLWITGSSPPASLIISPSRTQHFSAGSLSLSCEGQSDSTGWRVRRYTHSGEVSDCSSVTGSTCSIISLHTSLTGVYWCQSESGGGSDPLNITVHNGDVILDIPVHAVTEGDSLTLRCLFRSTKPSNLTADFYKDGSLLQTQTTGEMIIRTVSKSDEGLYHCKHPERGESPQSWLSVRASGPRSGSTEVIVGVSVGLSLILLLIIILGLICCYKKSKGDSAAQPSDDTYAEIMTTNSYRGSDEGA